METSAPWQGVWPTAAWTLNFTKWKYKHNLAAWMLFSG